ncbi:GNAT family N-acetyltransferase [Arenimonas sp.]|uniref:GNAT family N-acetyltransferase n=1 Tax=Arenimonas sp. TaxID=1872635 RepID=UPI0039E32072
MADTPTARRLPVLESARLRLRAFRDDDADDLFAIYSDPRVMRYWSFDAWTERRQAEEKLALIAKQMRETDVHPWAMADRQDDRLIGGVTLFAIDQVNRRGEIGYNLHPDRQGRGLAREAVRLALAYAFERLGLERIEADIDPRNEASCRLVEKLGFVREGLLRGRWRVAGEVCDTALYGLLREEYAT